MLLSAASPLPITAAELRAVELFYAAWTRHQPALLTEACAPDWQDIPLGPGQAPGPGGLQAIMRRFLQAFPDVEIEPLEVFGTQGRVGVRAEIRFTNPHAIEGAVPPGQRVRLALHEFHYLHEGRLTHTWHLEHGDFQPYAAYALG